MSDWNNPKEIGALLDEVSDKLPKLISGLMSSLYSPSVASDMGKAVGTLYTELKASGIPDDVALTMAKDYMLSMSNIVKNNFSDKSDS